MAETFNKSRSSGLSLDLRQGHSNEATSIVRKTDKSRHRASVACAACREKRVRCVVPVGRSKCVQCQNTGSGCIIKNDDERRRPISRAYMNSLAQRVTQLESMLKEHGAEPPPIAYPPKTTRGSLYLEGDSSPTKQVSTTTVQSIDLSASPSVASMRNTPDENLHGLPLISTVAPGESVHAAAIEVTVGCSSDYVGTPSTEQLPLVRSGHALATQNQAAARQGMDAPNKSKTIPQCTEDQNSRANRIVRNLPVGTHEYLLQNFFQHYNAVLHVVHERAFIEDMQQGKTQFYSGFLHICVLAMGFRFADKTRADIQQIALADHESTLHREAKHMLDQEIEQPGGIPSIAALLILGDCEVGAGRENMGWMYSGMAMRLAYDRSLHLDNRSASASVRESEVRRVTLWACVIYDRYWSVFSGRPTSMKSCDLEVYSLTNRFERLGTCKPAGEERSLHTRIFEALLDLMDVAGEIIDARSRGQHDGDHSGYANVISLDRELRGWAARLPQDLRYTEENRVDAPFSFYFLHQQYHGILIHLHRGSIGQERSRTYDQHSSEASRSICTESALAIALLFSHHRQKFDGRRIFSGAVHHAGAAATVLVAALTSTPHAPDSPTNMKYVDILQSAVNDISDAYAPAERIANGLEIAVSELKIKRLGPEKAPLLENPGMLARKNSRTLDSHTDRPVVKRRQTTHQRESSRERSKTASHGSGVATGTNQDSPPEPPSTGVLNMFPPQPQGEPVMWPSSTDATPFPFQRPVQTPFQLQGTPTLGHNPALNAQYWAQAPEAQALPAYPLLHMPSNPGDMCLAVDGQMPNFNFLLASEDDWARWHAGTGPGDIANDLDGFPPRNRFQGVEGAPSVGGILHG